MSSPAPRIGLVERIPFFWRFLALTLFLLLVASNTNAGWLLVLTSLMMAMMAVGIALAKLNLSRLEISRLVSSPTYQDTATTVKLTVKNPTSSYMGYVVLQDILPKHLAPDFEPPKLLIEQLAPKAQVTVSYIIPSPRRGVFELLAVNTLTTSPFDFYLAKRKVNCLSELVVYPHCYELDSTCNLAGLPDNESDNSIMRKGLSNDFYGLHAYQPGDDIRCIHWPSSARLNDIMVQEFCQETQRELTLIVETGQECVMGSPKHNNLEDVLAVAASLVKMAGQTAMPLKLVMSEDGAACAYTNNQGIQSPMHALAAAKMHSNACWPSLISLGSTAVNSTTSRLVVLAVSPTISAEDARMLSGLSSKVSVVLFYADDTDPQLASETLKPTYDQYLQTASALNELGLPTTVSTPQTNLTDTIYGHILS